LVQWNQHDEGGRSSLIVVPDPTNALMSLGHITFSIQFRENIEIACHFYLDDLRLRLLVQEECNTDDLSPWPGVASTGEKINHDEFMRRLLKLHPIDHVKRDNVIKYGPYITE
jgi:hypothetical protein